MRKGAHRKARRARIPASFTILASAVPLYFANEAVAMVASARHEKPHIASQPAT